MVEDIRFTITVEQKDGQGEGVSAADATQRGGSRTDAATAGAVAGSLTGGGKQNEALKNISKKYKFGGITEEGDLLIGKDTDLRGFFKAGRKGELSSSAKSGASNTLNKGLGSAKGFAAGGGAAQIRGFIGALFAHPYFLVALLAAGIIQAAIKQHFSDGAPGDRRLKLLIEEQVIDGLQREQLREIRTGKQIIRVSSAAGLGGRTGSYNSNLADINRGRYIEIDQNDPSHKNIQP